MFAATATPPIATTQELHDMSNAIGYRKAIMTPEAAVWAAPKELVDGDIVGRIRAIDDDGVVDYDHVRSIGKADGPTKLCFVKRGEHDTAAKFSDYVADGKCLVVGRVEVIAPQPKAKRTTKSTTLPKPKASRPAVDSKDDVHDKLIAAKRSPQSKTAAAMDEAIVSKYEVKGAAPKGQRVTKATAADVIDSQAAVLRTMADAMESLASALR